MADARENTEGQFRDITKCPICMSAFNDPRILPCNHTFCFQCLSHTSEETQMKPGDWMPCPLCRQHFNSPADGMNGVHKNFFMENLLEFKTTLQMGSVTIICDMCNVRNEGKTGEIPTATMRCLDCEDNYCDGCVKVHQFQRVSRYHQMTNIGSDMKTERERLVSMKSCTKHIQVPLDYYCAACKKTVCVLCLVESHNLHGCRDVTTVDEEFRKTIENKACRISTYMDEMMSMRNNKEKRKADFLKEIAEKENEIHNRSQELKDMIDRHTKSLLDELSVMKSNHLKEMENQLENIERWCTILGSFEAYCTELRLKGSASDICSSVDQLIASSYDLEKDHEAFIGRPHQSVEVSFQVTNLEDVLKNANSNFVGNVQETSKRLENVTLVFGLNHVTTVTNDVLKVNLHRSNKISAQGQIPTTMENEAAAAVYCNSVYVTGLRYNSDKIWKYNLDSGWLKCASLVRRRRRHSAAFIDEVLYICGGVVDPYEFVLDSVEAFNAVTNECTPVGKLVHAVQSSGNCVPFGSSLYIFGGRDKDNRQVRHVQLYNTKDNTCTLLSKPMPRSYCLMRAVLWETSVILLGRDTCYIFNIETEMWQERKQFKTDVVHFGLVLENERFFVIGGGICEREEGGETTWKCRNDVRYIPLKNILEDKPIQWKIHAILPQPAMNHAYGKIKVLCF